MLNISTTKFNKLKQELAVRIHVNEKLTDEWLNIKEDVTYKDMADSRRTVIERYHEDAVFNRLVNQMTNTVVSTLDLRIE